MTTSLQQSRIVSSVAMPLYVRATRDEDLRS
jgi:hypothetical protein